MNFRLLLIQLTVLLTINISYAQPWEYTITESSHNIIISEDLEILSDTGVIRPPIHIGVFYDSANTGNEVCAGYLYWTKGSQVLTAYGEYPSPINEDVTIGGFKSGERFHFKFAKNGCLLKIDSISYQEPGGFLISQRDEFTSGGVSKVNKVAITLGLITIDSPLICAASQDIAQLIVEGGMPYELNFPPELTINDTDQIIVNQSQEGSYGIEVNSNYCFNQNTINITIDKTALDLPEVIDSCGRVEINLSDSTRFEEIFWSTGSSESILEVKESGFYGVEATTLQGCRLVDTVEAVVYPIPNLDLGEDTASCSAIRLNAQGDFASIIWNTEDTTNYLQIPYPGGRFSAVATNEFGCITSDTVHIQITSDFAATLPADTTICQGDASIIQPTITGNYGVLEYRWNTGDRTPFLEVTTNGEYTVEVENKQDGCIATTSTQVFLSDFNIYLPADTTFCVGEDSIMRPLILGEHGALQYQWSTGETASQIKVGESGSYSVEVTNRSDNCTQAVSSEVILSDFEITLPSFSSSCDESLIIEPSIWGTHSNVEYKWNTGGVNPTLVVQQSGIYNVIATNNFDGCLDTASTQVAMGINPNWDEVDISVQDIDCNTQGVIELSSDSIPLEEAYEWSIDQESWQDLPIIESLDIGDYNLYTRHVETGCEYPVPGTFSILNRKTGQCKKVIVTPNEDGYQDYYEIECSNSIIYNRFGQPVAHFTQASKWYGRDDNGQVVKPGYYIIRCLDEGEEIGVSIIY